MKKNLFSQAIHIFTAVVRVALYFGNVAALGALGVKTVKLWTDKAFDLLETMKAFPAEAEFADLSAAERQVWRGIGFETFVFVIGGFLCYEFFIKPKNIRLRLIAPFVTAFLVLTGESVNLFLPALDKVHEIETCQMQGIPWSSRRHECDYMELERRRMERMRAAKKPVKVRKKTVPHKPATLPSKAAVPAPAVKAPAPKQIKPAAPKSEVKPKPKPEPKPEVKPVEPKAAADGQKTAPAAKPKPQPKRSHVKTTAAKAAKPEPTPAAQPPSDKPAKKLAPPKSLAP